MARSLKFPSARGFIDGSGHVIGPGFSVSVAQADIVSAGVVPVTKNAYTAANQPQNDLIEAVSDGAGDTTQTITFVGIDANGDRIQESVALNGVTAVSTTLYFTYWEYCYLSAACAGTVTIREASGNAAITTITAGDLVSYVAHVFSGEHTLWLTGFNLGITSISGNVYATIRRYPLAASCVALTGYVELDTTWIFDTEGVVPPARVYFPNAFRVGPGEYVCIAAVGEGTDDEDVVVSFDGLVMPGVSVLPGRP